MLWFALDNVNVIKRTQRDDVLLLGDERLLEKLLLRWYPIVVFGHFRTVLLCFGPHFDALLRFRCLCSRRFAHRDARCLDSNGHKVNPSVDKTKSYGYINIPESITVYVERSVAVFDFFGDRAGVVNGVFVDVVAGCWLPAEDCCFAGVGLLVDAFVFLTTGSRYAFVEIGLRLRRLPSSSSASETGSSFSSMLKSESTTSSSSFF